MSSRYFLGELGLILSRSWCTFGWFLGVFGGPIIPRCLGTPLEGTSLLLEVGEDFCESRGAFKFPGGGPFWRDHGKPFRVQGYF